MPLREIAAGTGPNHDQTPSIDIVAVHGLNPFNSGDHEYNTWRKPHCDDGSLWLRDHFPKVQPTARIFLYKYDSSPAFGAAKDSFVREANQLLEDILLKRWKTEPKRPLIFIGHSLGGILIKQALVNSHANEKYAPIKAATYGLVFFGTPHAGPAASMQIALGKACVAIARAVQWKPPNQNMDALEHGSLFDDLLRESFIQQLEQYRIVSFYEGIGNVVPYDSAVFHLAGLRETKLRINADHSNICRFNLSVEIDRDNYELVEGNLERLCLEATQNRDISSGSLGFGAGSTTSLGNATSDERNALPLGWSNSLNPIIINIHDLSRLSWDVYKSCEDSPSHLNATAEKISELYLSKKTNELMEQDSVTAEALSSSAIVVECYRVLQEIQNGLEKYKGFGARGQRTWDRMGYGVGEAELLNQKLMKNLPDLRNFHVELRENSTTRLETMLNAFISEIRSGQRAQSVVSSMTTESLSSDNDDFWAHLRRELEDIGISKVVLDTRRDFIIHRIIDDLLHDGSESDDQEKSHDASLESSPACTHELEQPALGEPATSTSLALKMWGPEKREPAAAQRTPKNSRVRPSLRSYFRKSKLLEVVQDENIAKVQACLESGYSPNSKTKRGSSALFLAAERDHTAIAALLCENGADVNVANSDSLQRTALHEAASRGSETLVQLLLKHGAQPDAKDAHNCTPLHRAIIGLESLFPSALFRSGLFMYFGTRIDLRGCRLPINEIMKKDRLARAANDKPNPMEWKVRKYERVVELLLSSGADAHANFKKGEGPYREYRNPTSTPLHVASKIGHTALVKKLLALKFDVDACGECQSTPLHVASAYGQQEVIKVLLKEGADIEATNRWGMTPLFLAAMQDADSIVSLLLQHGAWATGKTKSGYSPLHTAAKNGYEEVSRILIEGGARIEAVDKLKQTPLHVAAIAGQRVIVELLLTKGANIEARDHIKWTPLHRAIEGGHGDVVRFLLRQGANIQAEGILSEPDSNQRLSEKITPLRLLAQSPYSSLKPIAAEMRLAPMD